MAFVCIVSESRAQPDPCNWPGADCQVRQCFTAQGTHVAGEWPISGSATQDKLTSAFGHREYTNQAGDLVYDYHEGADIRADGDDVHAAWGGTIVRIGRPCWIVAGKLRKPEDPEPEGCRKTAHSVTLSHQLGGQTFYSFYTHLEPDERLRNLETNRTIAAGGVFATSGSTGVNDAHLHFGVFQNLANREGTALNPLRYNGLPQDHTAAPHIQVQRIDNPEPGTGQAHRLRFRVGSVATHQDCVDTNNCDDQLHLNRVKVWIKWDDPVNDEFDYADELVIDLDRRLRDGNTRTGAGTVTFNETTATENLPVELTIDPDPFAATDTRKWTNFELTIPEEWQNAVAGLDWLDITTVTACSSWSHREDVDCSEHCRSLRVLFQRDTDPPPGQFMGQRSATVATQANVQILAPGDGERLPANRPYPIMVSFTENAGIDSVELYVDGSFRSLTDDDGRAPWIFPWQPELLDLLGDTDVRLRAAGLDAGGQEIASHEITVFVHPSPPNVVIREPEDGSLLPQGPIDIVVDASDLDPGDDVYAVELEARDRNGTVVFSGQANRTNEGWHVQWPATGLPAGNYDIFAKAYDNYNLASPAYVTHVTLNSDLVACQPHDLVAERDDADPGTMHLSWSSTGASSFRVFAKHANQAEWPEPLASNLGTTSFTLENIDTCIDYDWKVEAACPTATADYISSSVARLRSCPAEDPVGIPIGDAGILITYPHIPWNDLNTKIATADYVCGIVGFDTNSFVPLRTEYGPLFVAKTFDKEGTWRISEEFSRAPNRFDSGPTSMLCFSTAVAASGGPGQARQIFMQDFDVPWTNHKDTGIPVDDYECGLAGWDSWYGDLEEQDTGDIVQSYMYKGASTWQIHSDLRSEDPHEEWRVRALCMDKEIVAVDHPQPQKPLFTRWFSDLGDNIDHATGIAADDYACGVIGFRAMHGDMNEHGHGRVLMTRMDAVDGEWRIRADFRTHKDHENWSVQALCAQRQDWSDPLPVAENISREEQGLGYCMSGSMKCQVLLDEWITVRGRVTVNGGGYSGAPSHFGYRCGNPDAIEVYVDDRNPATGRPAWSWPDQCVSSGDSLQLLAGLTYDLRGVSIVGGATRPFELLWDPPAEICTNGIDDDFDGETDCADSDCQSLPSCPPLAPTGASAVAHTATLVYLTWNHAQENADRFLIERKRLPGPPFAFFDTQSGQVTLKADHTVLPETRYAYRVRAENGAGVSGWSNVAIVLTPAPHPDVPAVPGGLVATASGPREIRLQWEDRSDNELWFFVERMPGLSSSTFETVTITGRDRTSFTHSGSAVLPETTYSFRVRAGNSFGDSSYSNVATVTTPSLGIPGPPTNLHKENFVIDALGTTKWRCQYDLVWNHPATEPLGEGLSYEYCVAQVSPATPPSCMNLPVGVTQTNHAVIYPQPLGGSTRYTFTTIRDNSIRGQSASITVYCGDP